MRGEVLHYDESQGFGFITGADGNRYTFTREDLRREAPMSKGTAVEFRPVAGQAKDIFSIRAQMQTAGSAPAPSVPQHFGRFAVNEAPASTGLWSYFWNGIAGNYANFRGRARRKEYWGFALFFYLALTVLSLIGVALDFALGNMEGGDETPVATVAISGICVLAAIIPWVAVSVRRQHDIGLSGWFYLLILVPYIGSLILFVFSLIPSQKHDNKWGPVPAGVRIPPPFTPPGTSK